MTAADMIAIYNALRGALSIAVFRAWPGREPGGWMSLRIDNPRYASVTRRLCEALDTGLMAALNAHSRP